MKSFSSTSFAGEHTEALASALAAVAKNPRALFTDFQWFLFEAKDTVFFTAFSETSFDKDGLGNLVALDANRLKRSSQLFGLLLREFLSFRSTLCKRLCIHDVLAIFAHPPRVSKPADRIPDELKNERRPAILGSEWHAGARVSMNL